MKGYHGFNCTLQCPFPTYGIRCQKYCNCSKDLCDVSKGCSTLDNGTFFFSRVFSVENLFHFILHCIDNLSNTGIVFNGFKGTQVYQW